nr:hypothetical protein [Ardenticatena sp.]
MSAITTDTLMQIALDMAGMERIPGDCGIFVPGERIQRLLVGLDIDTGDLLLAKQLGYDCVLAHHFRGTEAELTGWQVYQRHIDLMVAAGVPRLAAEEAVYERLDLMRVAAHAANYDRVSGAARLLGMPFLNIHSPLDELGRAAMQRAVDELLRDNPQATVAEVAAHLSATFEEFQVARTRVAIRLGDPDAPAGRVVVAHGALTNGGAAVARAYFEHGIDTVIYIHIAPQELVKLQNEARGNLIVTGHIASDAIGINIYLDELERRGLHITTLNGIVPRR